MHLFIYLGLYQFMEFTCGPELIVQHHRTYLNNLKGKMRYGVFLSARALVPYCSISIPTSQEE